MKTRLKVTLLLGGVLALGAILPAQAQKVLKFGHTVTANSHYGVAVEAFIQEASRLSNGTLKIEHHPNGALGDERALIEGAQLGTVDLVMTSTGPVGNFVPETLITDLPFLFTSSEHAHAVLDGPIGQEILAKFPAKGLVALVWAENGFRNLTNSKRAIDSPDDVKGLKLRTMQNPVHMTAFKQIGALPTPMAYTELFTALQQGTVDGQENPIPTILSGKFAQVQKHLTLSRHIYSPALILASKATFDGLSPADQDALRQAAKVAVKVNREKVAELDRTGIDQLRRDGMQVITDVDTAKFQAALAPVYTEYAKKFGQDRIDAIRNYK